MRGSPGFSPKVLRGEARQFKTQKIHEANVFLRMVSFLMGAVVWSQRSVFFKEKNKKNDGVLIVKRLETLIFFESSMEKSYLFKSKSA